MTTIGTLKIEIKLEGSKEAISGLNDVNAAANKVGGSSGGVSNSLVAFNKLRWAMMGVNMVLDKVKDSFVFFANIAKAQFSFLKGSIEQLIINPMKIALTTALSLGAALSAAAISFGSAAVQEFGNFEATMIDVRKTTNMTAEEIDVLGEKLSLMSLESQTSAIDLGKIAAAAGQLGIRGTENILGFTKAIDMISIATNVSAADAANNFGRMAEMMGLEKTEATFMSMGDVINELSNTTAASASDIVQALSNIGNTGRVLGVDFKTQAALVSAAISTGFLPPKKAGVSLRRFFEQVVAKTEDVGKIMGITGEAVKKNISEDAVGFMKKFLESVRASGNQAEILATMMDITGARAGQAANAFLMNWDKVEETLETSNKQWEEGGSLVKEFEFQMEGLKAQIAVAINYWNRLKEKIGEVIAPHIKDSLKEFKIIFENMIKPLSDVAGFLSKELFDSLNSVLKLISGAVRSDGITSFIKDFKNGFVLVKNSIMSFGGAVFSVFNTVLPSAITIAKTYLNGLFAFFEGINMSSSIYFLANAFKKLSDALSSEAFGAVKGVFSSLGEIIGMAAFKVNEFFTALTDGGSGASALTKILKNVSSYFTSIKDGLGDINMEGVVNVLVQISGIMKRLAQRANVWIGLLLNFFSNSDVLNSLESFGNLLIDISGAIALIGSGLITLIGYIYKVSTAVILDLLEPFITIYDIVKNIIGLLSGDISFGDAFKNMGASILEGLIPDKSIRAMFGSNEKDTKGENLESSETQISAADIQKKSVEQFDLITKLFGKNSLFASDKMASASEVAITAANEQMNAAQIVNYAAEKMLEAANKDAAGSDSSSDSETSSGSNKPKNWDDLAPEWQDKYNGIGLDEGNMRIGDTDITEHVRNGGIVSKRDKFIREAYEKKDARDAGATQAGRDMLTVEPTTQEKGDAMMNQITATNFVATISSSDTRQ